MADKFDEIAMNVATRSGIKGIDIRLVRDFA